MIKLQDKTPIFISLIIMIAAQIGTNFYLVALPQVAKFFASSPAMVLDTVYYYLIPYGLCQLFIAPFVNRLGFKKTALIGFFVFTLGILTIIFSPSIFFFSLGRVIQGFGGATIYVIIRMLIQKSYKPEETNIAFSIIESFAMATPIIAPILGAYLLKIMDWRGLFYFILIYCLFAIFMVLKLMQNQKIYPTPKIKAIIKGYKILLIKWEYSRFLISALALCMPTFFGLATIPFVLSGRFNLAPTQYSFLMSLCIVGSFFGSFFSKIANERGFKNNLIKFAITLLFLDGIFLFFMQSILLLPVFIFACVIVFFTYGAVFPNIMADYFKQITNKTGLEVALIGFFQVAGSAIINFFITRFTSSVEQALSFIFIFASVVIFFTYKIPTNQSKKDPIWHSIKFLKKRLT